MIYNKQGFIDAITKMMVVVLLFLIVAMGFEYYLICRQTQHVMHLKRDYQHYIALVKKASESGVRYKGSHSIENMADNVVAIPYVEKKDGDQFVPVKRNPEYLKTSMVNYLKEQKLDQLLHRVDLSLWDTDLMVAPTRHTAVNNGRRQKKRVPSHGRSGSGVNMTGVEMYHDIHGSKKKIFFYGLSSDLIFG